MLSRHVVITNDDGTSNEFKFDDLLVMPRRLYEYLGYSQEDEKAAHQSW